MKPAHLATDLPALPGIYQFFDEAGACLYVGKAKNLRRRLAQYRNAKRLKAHKKMRAILKAAHRVQTEVLTTELEALLEENKLIQSLRPKFNCDGAYSFMYPFWGVKEAQWGSVFVLTQTPSQYPDMEFFGAFRSRRESRAAFEAWTELTRYLGHPVPPKTLRGFKCDRFDKVHAIRKLDPRVLEGLKAYLRGTSRDLLELLVLSLVESAGARKQPQMIQEHLRCLKRFFTNEPQLLNRAIECCGVNEYPVSQESRDRLLVQARACGFQKPPSSPEREALSSLSSPLRRG